MAEAFSNSLTRAAGIVTTSAAGAIGITTNKITGISTVGVAVSDLVINQHFNGGTKVSSVGASQVVVDVNSTNSAAASSQTVKFLGVTTCYTSAAKSVLIGGTFGNNTLNEATIYIEVYDASGPKSVNLGYNIPVPTGSSFVISDAGKTLLEASDQLRIYCDTANGIDATLSILTGVS